MYSLILLLLFLFGMVAIGVWGMRKTTSMNDFFLGGRTVGPWISAFAYGTTYFSAVLFIGFAVSRAGSLVSAPCGSGSETPCSAPCLRGLCSPKEPGS